MALRLYNLDPVVIDSGNVAKALTSEPILAASITLQMDYNNVGRMAVGGVGVTVSNGIQCAPGESVVIEFTKVAGFTDEFELNNIYVVSATAGDSCRVVYIKRS